MTQNSAPDVSVILPLYNCADSVVPLLTRLKCSMGGKQFEVIAVDDASPDASASLVDETARELGIPCSVVQLVHNKGQNEAVLEGLRAARGAIMVVMDADMQDPPEMVPALCGELSDRRVDIVFARRHGRYCERSKSVTSLAFKWFLFMLLKSPVDPRVGLFLALSRRARERLLGIRIKSPYVLGMLAWLRLSSATLPFKRQERSHGRSATSSWKRFRLALSAFICVAKCQLFYRDLRM